MTNKQIIRERLRNILKQLSNDQQEELMEMLLTEPKFQPEGYPFSYTCKSFYELNDEEVAYLHKEFIELQYSDEPKLQGEDIRNVLIYPYVDLTNI